MTEYSYVILKYRHDAAADEVMNVGVVMFAPATGQVGVISLSKYGRLSEAFANFDGQLYHAIMNRLANQLNILNVRMSEGLFQVVERQQFEDAGALVRTAWPDQGLAYFISPVLFGICNDVEKELAQLHERFVTSQHDERTGPARFSDDAVWSGLRAVLSRRGIDGVLQPKTLGISEIEFDHAYKNGKWHVIEPVSLDYINPSQIKERALLTVGKASAVRDLPDFGTFHIVIGKPLRVATEKQFSNAINLLKTMPVRHEIVLPHEVEDFAARLEADLEKHNLIPELRRA